MRLQICTVGPYQTNCYILSDDTGIAWIVDPGAEGDAIADLIGRMGVTPRVILLTHTHWDHVSGIPALMHRWPALEVMASEADSPFLGPDAYDRFCKVMSDKAFLALYGDELKKLPKATRILKDGDLVEGPGLLVISTPGHTPGGLAFYQKEEKWLFSGDTLFAGSIGRTDFAGGSYADELMSCKKLVALLPGETAVYPGHGPETTISRELATNPYLA